MRLRIAVCAVFALGLVTARFGGADEWVAPDDNLLAGAGHVMDATAVKQLAERDWLFKGTPILRWIGTEGLSPHFVGWWNVAPEGSEHWASMFPLRPAPHNSGSLVEGRRFLVVADEDFHLLLVYPVKPQAGDYLRGMSEREFRDHVVALRSLHATVREFLAGVSDADWFSARLPLSAALRKGVDASSDPDSYFARLGVPRIQASALTGADVRPTVSITSLKDGKAEVVVQGDDTRRAKARSGVWVRLLLSLTRTRRTMGPSGWEIVKIKKIAEQPSPLARPVAPAR